MDNFSNYNMDKHISIRSMTSIEDKDSYDRPTIVDWKTKDKNNPRVIVFQKKNQQCWEQ